MFDRQKQLQWSKLKVGLVITIAILVLCLAVFFAGNIQSLISKKVELNIQFRQVEGLRKGAPVWILGIEEGYVERLELNPAYGVIVTIVVKKNSLRFIKKDSEATISTMGLLGDKYVELRTGSPQAEPAQPGEMLKGVTETGLKSVMESSGRAIERIHSSVKRLDEIFTKIEKGQGTLAKFIEDPSVYNNLKRTTEHLSAITEEIKNSQGTLRMLIENPSLYQKTLTAVTSVEEFTRNLNKSSGTLRKLIEDPELYDNLNKASSQLSSIIAGIEDGKGLAGAIINDEKLTRDVRELVRELRNLSSELEDVAKEIKKHPGEYLKFKFSLF